MWRTDLFEKTLMLGKIEGRRKRGQEKKMRWLDGITNSMDMFAKALGIGDGQGSLASWSPWGCKVSDMTEWLNWSELNWCWSSNPLATWCEELTHWKRPWCWERLKTGGEGDDRGWVGWMASLTRWTWLWAVSGSWWWTGKPGVLQSMGSQRVGHNWVTKLNWTN